MEEKKAVTTTAIRTITRAGIVRNRLKGVMETSISDVARTSKGLRPLPNHRVAIPLLVKKKKKRPSRSKDKEEVVASRPAKIRVRISSPKTQDLRPPNKPRIKKSPRLQRNQRLAGVQLCSKPSRTKVEQKIVLRRRRPRFHQNLREVRLLEVVVLTREAVVEVVLVAPLEEEEVVVRSRFVPITSN